MTSLDTFHSYSPFHFTHWSFSGGSSGHLWGWFGRKWAFLGILGTATSLNLCLNNIKQLGSFDMTPLDLFHLYLDFHSIHGGSRGTFMRLIWWKIRFFPYFWPYEQYKSMFDKHLTNFFWLIWPLSTIPIDFYNFSTHRGFTWVINKADLVKNQHFIKFSPPWSV